MCKSAAAGCESATKNRQSYSRLKRESQRTFRTGAEASLRHRGSSEAGGPGHVGSPLPSVEGLTFEPGWQGSGTQDYHSGEARKLHDKDAQGVTSLDDPSPSPSPCLPLECVYGPRSHRETYRTSRHLYLPAPLPPLLLLFLKERRGGRKKEKEKSEQDKTDILEICTPPSNFPSPVHIASHSEQRESLLQVNDMVYLITNMARTSPLASRTYCTCPPISPRLGGDFK